MIDDEYFIVCYPCQDDQQHDLLPFVGPDPDTVDTPYLTQPLPLGHKPQVFINAEKQIRARRGETTIRTVPPVLFDGDNVIVKGSIREKLLTLEIPNIVLQPSIYIDDWDVWHEDYWFITFLEEFNGWDRHKSEVGEKIRVMDKEYYSILRVSLDEARLKSMPLRERLLLQLDTFPGLVLAHESIAGLFAGNGHSGALVVSLADYPNRP